MSYSIMEALLYGKIIPWERRSDMSAKHKAVLKKIESERRHFVEKMSLDDCRRFEEFESLLAEAGSYDEVDTYTHGFTLGALLMHEVLEKKKAIYNPI